jgi:CelD/BcsL family acetyltransferase involved in cellulose biosynthesis
VGTVLHVATTAAASGLTFDTIRSDAAFARLGGEWDTLVRSMPRPSPVLLHGWLRAWWRHYGEDAELAVHVAYRDGRLVGALPLCVNRRYGLRVLTFLGGDQSPLADLILDEQEGAGVLAGLAERAASTDHDYADLFGLPVASRLGAAVGPSALRTIERAEAPVLVLSEPWNDVYQRRLSSKKRAHHRRRRRQLAELGTVGLTLARTPDELAAALEDAFRLHTLRWHGRPDGSRFATSTGRRFHREAVQALAAVDAARIITTTLDGRAIAFHYYFLLERRMYVHRIAFDPAFARWSPGAINTLDAIEAAAAEGATRIEFLGGADRYKLELADHFEPLCQAFGLAATARGSLAVAARLAAIRARKQLKRSQALRHFYMEGLAPARRVIGRLS